MYNKKTYKPDTTGYRAIIMTTKNITKDDIMSSAEFTRKHEPQAGSISSRTFNLICSPDNKDAEWLYRSNETAYKKGYADPAFRGIVKYSGDIEQLNEMIDACEEEIKQNNGKILSRLPYNTPKIIDDNVFKILVHENKAHASVNRNSGWLKLIGFRTQSSGPKRDTISVFLKEIAEKMEESGYEVRVKGSSQSVSLEVDVGTLCQRYRCKSIQMRHSTGRRIRANYYSLDESGFLEKSELKNIGVLVIPHKMDVEVLKSHDRKIRKDAIYTGQHEDEIIFKDIPEGYMKDRIYKKGQI